MKPNLRIIAALVRKDLLGLLPLVLLTCAAAFVVPLVSSLDLVNMGGDSEFWIVLQANIYWLGFFLGVILMISVVQLDPADSLDHDWLTRPIPRRDWCLAKLVFLLIAFVMPVLLGRFLVNLSSGMGPGLALNYAAGIESFEGLMLVPLLLMAALLAPTLRRLILLMVGVFFVFLLPGWSVTRPLLAALGIELGSEFEALMWVQGTIVVVASLIGAALVFWLHYCRRRRLGATLAFWAAVAVIFFAVYPPASLYTWERAIDLNASLINDDNAALEHQVILEPATACFAATLVDDSNHTEQESRLLAAAAWPESYLEAAGAGALSFATPIRYREILTEWFVSQDARREHSIEWRLDRMRTRARLTADTLTGDVPLLRSHTIENRLAPIAAIETDYWLVPGDALAKLAQDPSAQLELTIDGMLLAPTPHELPVDGHYHEYPQLGSCKAERDSLANEIRIECLKRGAQPELLSAQFIGMDSSRVDSAVGGSYSHDWVEALKRQRYELILDAPSLVDPDSVIVTAYNAERLLRKTLVLPGLLGNDRAICPLPGETHRDVERATSWSDNSPHEVSYVSVERGVRLEVLDWRRNIKPDAPTLLLLPGLGATAHSYDELAPRLAEHYNVIGMTRRGTGDSGKPERGYDIARLSQDVLQLMDALGLDTAILVGHSFGGEELSWLGAHNPDRIDGLVYLDAAYDRVSVNSGEDYKRYLQLERSLPQAPPIRPAEAVSYEAMHAYARRTGRSGNIPEGEIIASYDLNTGAIMHDALYLDALMQGIVTPDYATIAVPALALYAMPDSPEAMMEAWYDQGDPAVQAAVMELFRMDRARKQHEITRFDNEVSDSEVVALANADHWIFVSHPDEVLTAIEHFVGRLSVMLP